MTATTETHTACPRCAAPLPADAPEGLCPRCLMATALAPDSPATAAGFEAPAIEALEPLFPQFELLRLIGRGGMGAVYEARDKKLDRKVALKVLPPALADELGFVERFTREARAMARLNHPHVVAIHDFGEVEGCCYLVLELVDGSNLRQKMAGPMAPAEAAAILRQASAALAYAHERGIVHRDVKPENILVGADGRVRLADFGLAKAAAEGALHSLLPSLTATRQAMGTPHYMAPEQLEGREVDARADLYSLGVVAYELVTGSLPLGRFPDPSRTRGVDAAWDAPLLQALERDPADRQADAAELAAAFEALERGGVVTVAKPASAAPTRRRRSGEHAAKEGVAVTPAAAPTSSAEESRAAARRQNLSIMAAIAFVAFLAGFLPWVRVPVELLGLRGGTQTFTGWEAKLILGRLELPTWPLPLGALLIAGFAAFSSYQRRDAWKPLLGLAGAGVLCTLFFMVQALQAPRVMLQLGPMADLVGFILVALFALRAAHAERPAAEPAPSGPRLNPKERVLAESRGLLFRRRSHLRRKKALRERLGGSEEEAEPRERAIPVRSAAAADERRRDEALHKAVVIVGAVLGGLTVLALMAFFGLM
ncbi:MAG: serine/threonine-protein kinase [Planctomycetota bacterium]